MASKDQKINPKLLDELLQDQDQDPEKVFQQDGLLGDLKKALTAYIMGGTTYHASYPLSMLALC